jgi:hypothetical protein
MENESSNAGSQGWVEGGPVEGLSPEAARSEIKAIESDPSFAGEGKMAFWPRQQMLRRRDALYRRAGPSDPEREISRDKGMYDTLKAQGITKESLQADIEKFEDRDTKEAMQKATHDLELHFGGEKAGEEALKLAQGVLKRFGKPQDLAFLESTGLGNDPELIGILAQLAKKLDRKGKK